MLEKLEKYFKRPMGLVLIVAYKGIWGLVEILLGLGAVIFSGALHEVAKSDYVHGLILRELAEDPQDIFVNWLLAHVRWFDSAIYIGWIFVALGLIKVGLAVGVWYRSWAVRDIGIIFFSGVAVFGIYEIASNFSFLKFVVLLLDIAILFYFWQSLPKHLGPRKGKISNI
jgi:uncharacterized membrane protein